MTKNTTAAAGTGGSFVKREVQKNNLRNFWEVNMPTDDGRCTACNVILMTVDYIRGECLTCGWEIEDD